MASQLTFLTREKDCIKLYNVDLVNDCTLAESEDAFCQLALPKAAVWSPDGFALAIADPSVGLQVIAFTGSGETLGRQTLPGSQKTVQAFSWSPLGTALLSISPGCKGSTEPNLHVFRRQARGNAYFLEASFSHPKGEKDRKVLQWNCDESLCARHLPDGNIDILNGVDLSTAPLLEMKLSAPAQTFEFAPIQPAGRLRARIAVFSADTRDDMQRVVGPATCTTFELLDEDGTLKAEVQVRVSISSGQVGELMWNHSGTALLVHGQTEVDESGQSYYGGSKLYLVSHDGNFVQDLTGLDNGEPSGVTCSMLQAVAWNPARDEFIIIRGFQPSQASLFRWFPVEQSVALVQVLTEKAHRNTIRFNRFGSLVCLAGFGNLAGQVDFYGRDEEACDYVRVSSCQANCTVSAEWAPDGRHFLTSVLAPRMRVDNGVSIWRALTGAKVCSNSCSEELFDTAWRPMPAENGLSLGIAKEEIQEACKECGTPGTAGREVYRPPKARGVSHNTVAAMMRGEVATPEEDRRHRKARQPMLRQREVEEAGHECTGQFSPPATSPLPGAVASQRGPAFDGALTGDVDQQHQQTSHGRKQPFSTAQRHQEQENRVDYPQRDDMNASLQERPWQRGQQKQANDSQRHVQQEHSRQMSHQSSQGSSPAEALQGTPSHGQKLPCPESGWEYIDPKQQIQGPFSLLEMQQWYRMGYFRPDLPMRCDAADSFRPFKELFPHPLIPFQSYPKRSSRRQQLMR